MNRLFDDLTGRHINKGTVLEKGSVQRGKSIVVADGMPAKMFFEQFRLPVERRRKAVHDDTLIRRGGGQVPQEMTIEEYEPTSRQASESETSQLFRRDAIAR